LVFCRVTHGRRVNLNKKWNFGFVALNHGRRVNFHENP
jgi:hypothetical protein